MDMLKLLDNIILSRALYTAAELDIAEYLSESSIDIESLANKTSCDVSTLNRLMKYLVFHEVFVMNSDNTYSNTAFSNTMISTHPQSIKPLVLHDDNTRWNCYGNLTYSIKTGQDAFSNLYKQPYFQYLANHPELSQRFDSAMTIISNEEDSIISSALQFEGIVADIGGGAGQLLDRIKDKQSSGIKTILFDLPEVVNKVKESKHLKIAGSFFDTISIDASTFILKRIIHDWNNDDAIVILNNVRQTMKESDTLFIIEGLLDKSDLKKELSAVDLALLTIFKGQERSLGEIETLLSKAELKVTEIIKLTPILFAIKCQRA